MTFIRFWFLVLSFVFFFPSALFALDKPFDHSAWDQFLKEFVNEQGEVNYEAAQKTPTLLNHYIEQLAAVDYEDLVRKWPREEKLALWLNAYHVGVTRAILDHYPVQSIQNIAGVWDLPLVRIGNQTFSLNHIRARQLLGVYRDEKIHLALACGAKSCPRLRREAFTGPRVEGQLFLATRDFVNDPIYTQITPGQKKIHVSRIFKWYAKDFTLDFGSVEIGRKLAPEEIAVLSFIAHYLEDSQKVQYLEDGRYKIQYLLFDWKLNDWHSASA